MEIEVSAEAKGKRLNRLVAITVVALSVFMGLTKVKDDNIVQAMQAAKSDAVDTWGEYQATRTKRHIAETARDQLAAVDSPKTDAFEAQLTADMTKYDKETADLRKKAEGLDAQYDALNVHDDQFDASDALLSIAVSLAAVSALVESLPVLVAGWGFSALGLLMGVAGFAGWSLHWGALSALLG